MVQVEYAGTCINSKPNRDVENPHFAELFIFPVSKQSESMSTKVFISLLVVEGKSEIPADLSVLEEG